MSLLSYKNILFDDWSKAKDIDGNVGYWAEICGKHAKQYADVLANELDESGGWGCCSVCGCDFCGEDQPDEEQYYVDFDPSLVSFVKDNINKECTT